MALELGPIIRSAARQRSASSLVILELATGFAAISCLLLASTWYETLAGRPSGYQHDDLIMVSLQRPASAATEAEGQSAAAREAGEQLTRIRALPEVDAVATLSSGMLDQRWNYPVQVQSLRPGAGGKPAATAVGWTGYTSPDIGVVLGLQVREGAFPARLPAADLSVVTVLTRCLRERLIPDGAPAVGRVVRADDAPPATVVAVVEDVVLRDPWNAHGSCVSIRFGWPADERETRFLVRTRPGQRQAALPGLRAAVGEPGPQRRVEVAPFDPDNAHPTRMARGLVVNLSVFGAIVILSALLGTLTVSSFLVSERTRSVGIRRALGAQPRDIVRYFLVETSLLTAVGVMVGLLFTAAVFWGMQRLYPGLQLSPRSLSLTALLLWLSATLGALHPARRAAQTPPWSATRSP